MLELPPVAPLTGWVTSTRLPRDHYVRLAGNDYSVHPAAVARMVTVTADLDTVRVACGGETVATHARCWAKQQTITDPAHRQTATDMRASHRIAAGSASRSKAVHRPGGGPAVDVVTRSLSDYDDALNGASGAAAPMPGQVA
jgi:hypothetical protein